MLVCSNYGIVFGIMKSVLSPAYLASAFTTATGQLQAKCYEREIGKTIPNVCIQNTGTTLMIVFLMLQCPSCYKHSH